MKAYQNKEELIEVFNWYLLIRWIFVALALLAVFLLRYIGRFEFPLIPIYTLIAFITLYNVVFTLYHWGLKSKRLIKSSKNLRKFAHAQIILDLVALATLIQLTGGLESPFAFFFILPAVSSTVFLSPRLSLSYAAAAILLYGGVIVSEYFLLLPHFHSTSLFPRHLYKHAGYVIAALAAFSGILGFSGYFSFFLARKLKENEERLFSQLEIGRILRSTLHLKSLLRKILDEVLPLIGAEKGTVFLLDEDGYLRLKAGRGLKPGTENFRLKLGEGFLGMAAREGQITVNRDASADSHKILYQGLLSETQLNLPLKSRDKIIGVLNVVPLKPKRHWKREDGFLLSIADRVAAALDNALLFERAEKRVSQLSLLYRVGKAINIVPDLKKLLRLALENVLGLLQVDSGSITLSDAPKKGVTVKIDREGAKRGKAVIEQDTNTLSIPLETKSGVIGTFTIEKKASREFSRADMDLLDAIGSEVALAIENAFLQESRKKEAKQIALINETSRLIGSSLDIDQIYSTLVSELEKLIHFDRVSISLLDESGENVEVFAVTNKGEILERRVAKPKDVCCASWVTEHKKPLLRPDLEKEPRFLDDKIIVEQGIKTCFSLPLMVRDRVLGTFCLYNQRKAAYSQEDLLILQPIAEQLAVAIENAKLYQNLRESLLRTVEALAKAADAKDSYTAGHSERVTKYALALAEDFGFSPTEREGLEIAAKLHDIGKIGISENLLLKAEKLTKKERETIKKHPVIATSILTPLNFSENILKWIKHHHEQPDGQGYPDALPQRKLPLGASILKVADAFEAMTSDRPYRKALSSDEALFELEKNAGIQFDAKVVKSFSKIINKNSLLPT